MESAGFFQIGYGGQGKAWYPSLSEAGLNPILVLREGKGSSFELARQNGYDPLPIHQFGSRLKSGSTVMLLVPDRIIGTTYDTYLRSYSELKLNIILATGFAIWSGDLKPVNQHTVHMIAPKAIGPELRSAIQNEKPNHQLKAAVSPGILDNTECLKILTALGFSNQNLITATFEQEAVGDLISEQLLLCGGLFTLFEETISAMKEAGIPEALIQEECGTELVLIARMLRDRGLDTTRAAISDTAKQGARVTTAALKAGGITEILKARVHAIRSKKFLQELKST